MVFVVGLRFWACFWDVCGFVGAPLAPRRFRFRRAVWACVLGPGLACAQPFLAGLSGCVFFSLRFGFFFSFFFFFGPCGLCPSISPLSGWAGGSLFFFFPCPFSPWSAVTGLVLPVLGRWSPCASVGVLFFFFCLLGGGLAACGGVGGRFGGCGLFSCLFPLPPPFIFFWGGACLFLPLPSLGWHTHWPAFSVVFRAAVFICVLCGLVPAPWVGWALYTVGSAPLLAGLGPGSAGWAAAPGGCLWFWVRGLGLFVSLPLCGAVVAWRAVAPCVACGAGVWRGGAAPSRVCGGWLRLVPQVRVSCVVLCRSVPRRVTSCCGALLCAALWCGVPWSRVVPRWVSGGQPGLCGSGRSSGNSAE